MSSFEELAEQLSMTELIRLQDVLSRALVRRFEKRLALVFSDMVGSTPYFARFGDEAGRKLQQRHTDLVSRVLTPAGGRIVDTAGDGIFLCFDDVTIALRALLELLRAILADNEALPAEHRLHVRVGLHFGHALTDGTLVSGDAVNFASRVAASAAADELRISQAAFHELSDAELRLRSHRVRDVELKRVPGAHDLFTVEWLDAQDFPTRVRFEDGTEVKLPQQEVIRFGRLRDQGDGTGNDIVLAIADPELQSRVSRWHFELHRRATGFVLKPVSKSPTEIDGRPIKSGEEAPLPPGAKVKLGGAVTLEFLADDFSTEMTLLPPR